MVKRMNNVIFSVVSTFAAIVILARLTGLVIMKTRSNYWPPPEVPVLIRIRGKPPQRRADVQSEWVKDYMDFQSSNIRLEWPTQHLVLPRQRPCGVVVIQTEAERKPQRMLIRQTWKKWCGDESEVKFLFFMGLPREGDLRNLFLESAEYDDMVVDGYTEKLQEKYGRPLKVLRMLHWFQHFYEGSSPKVRPAFVVKAEDDVFLHIPNILLLLRNISGSAIPRKYLGGHLHRPKRLLPAGKASPQTLKSVLEPPATSALPLHLGDNFYILSSDLIPELLEASFKVPLVPAEDVYITGKLANQTLGIPLQHLSGKGIVERRAELQEVLRYKNNIWGALAYHGINDPDLMRFLFQTADVHVNQKYGA